MSYLRLVLTVSFVLYVGDKRVEEPFKYTSTVLFHDLFESVLSVTLTELIPWMSHKLNHNVL